MKKGCENKRKFKKLQKRLGLPLYSCVGVLEMLWAGSLRADGDLR